MRQVNTNGLQLHNLTKVRQDAYPMKIHGVHALNNREHATACPTSSVGLCRHIRSGKELVLRENDLAPRTLPACGTHQVVVRLGANPELPGGRVAAYPASSGGTSVRQISTFTQQKRTW